MAFLEFEVRRGAYFDSIVLMQLQSALRQLPGVDDSGVVMASEANRSLLASRGLLPDSLAADVGPEDLIVVVSGSSESSAEDALGQVDALLKRRRGGGEGDDEYRPRSLRSAVRQRPDATWVSISLPGRWAGEVAHQALDLGRNVFLFSDNVSLAEEAALKRKAEALGLLVMGPDCGTARIGGAGLGFCNRVRTGKIGLVGASGTGLQTAISQIHARGHGVSQAIGTGGRDLSDDVGAISARQGLDLLARDPETKVIVLISKPPSPRVASRLLAAAQATGKRVVVYFLGYPIPGRRLDALRFVTSLQDVAPSAIKLLKASHSPTVGTGAISGPFRGYLRGLFAGGTLAQEALKGLRSFVQPLSSNLLFDGVEKLADVHRSQGHCVVDLGDDELTVGRPHPMIDLETSRRRVLQEAQDPEVGTLLIDLVLGDGAHPNPASELAPAIVEAKARSAPLDVMAVIVGTDQDPQDLTSQAEQLRQAGARVFGDVSEAISDLAQRWDIAEIVSDGSISAGSDDPSSRPVPLSVLEPPVVINVGLEILHDSLVAQEIASLHMNWRPPAGGRDDLLAILDRMKDSPQAENRGNTHDSR